jgi:hypothetical protein
MKILLNDKLETPKPNEQRIVRLFVWCPRIINYHWIWLSFIEAFQVYKVEEFPVKIDDKQKVFLVGKWITVSEKVN